jgi:hypothetical protein
MTLEVARSSRRRRREAGAEVVESEPNSGFARRGQLGPDGVLVPKQALSLRRARGRPRPRRRSRATTAERAAGDGAGWRDE